MLCLSLKTMKMENFFIQETKDLYVFIRSISYENGLEILLFKEIRNITHNMIPKSTHQHTYVNKRR